MSEQAEALPAEQRRNVEDVTDVLPDVVSRVGRAVRAQAVTRRVERDNVATLEPGRDQGEAAGIVEPTMQGDDGKLVRIAPAQRCQLVSRQAEADLARRSIVRRRRDRPYRDRSLRGCSLSRRAYSANWSSKPCGARVGASVRIVVSPSLPSACNCSSSCSV